VTEFLAEEYPQISVEVHRGGQPLYPYYFGLEVSDAPARRLRQLGDVSVSQLRNIGEKRTAALASLGSTTSSTS